MFQTNLSWIIALMVCLASASQIRLPDEAKTEGRQSQSFFPKESSSNPNFNPSSHDVYYVESNIQVAGHGQNTPKQPDYFHNPKFSPELQEDLYNNRFGAKPSQQQVAQQQLAQQQLAQQQLAQQQLAQQQLAQQQVAQQQYQQYRPQQESQYVQTPKPIYPENTNEIYYNEITQQQYSPQSQQYVENTNFAYSQPSKQQGIGPFFSPATTGNYPQHTNRPHSAPQVYNRPPQSLYPANPSNQYYGHYGDNGRPVYQSQQNYHVRPPQEYENGGGITGTISNFISNAVDLFQNRPAVNQYQSPATGITPNRGPETAYPTYGGITPINPVNQFAKAIEEITRNDDFQCIPKVICQMVGNQRRQPSILGSPIFSAIISALPSTSAGMVYGRAALLGLVSGAQNCHTAYPKCPHNEDDLLYYLNNHRGGFFRFFNGGAAFGDDTNYQYRPNPPYSQNNQYQQQQQQQQHQQYNQHNQQNYYQQQQQQQHQQYRPPQQNPQEEESSLQVGLAALQNIAEAVNNGGGINLSNLGSNGFGALAGLLNGQGSSSGSSSSNSGGFDLSSLASNLGGIANLGGLANLVGGGNQGSKPSKAPVDDQGASLTELVGNLLTGFVGQRFASRKIQKRSIEVFDDDNDNSIDQSVKDDVHNSDEIEGRILNNRPAIPSTIRDDDYDDEERFQFQSNRGGKRPQYTDRVVGPTPIPQYATTQQNLFFPYRNDENEYVNNDGFRIPSNHRTQKGMKFPNNAEQSNSGFFSNDNGNNYNNNYQQRPAQYDDSSANYNNNNNYQQRPVQYDDSSANYNNNNNYQQRPVQYDDSSAIFNNNNNYRPNKMIFPDRTGTGNLKFDNDQFDRPSNGNRYGKILNNYGNGNGNNNRGQYNGNGGGGTRVLFDQENDDNNNNNNRYTSQNYRPFTSNNDNYGQNNFNYNRPSQSTYNQNSNYGGGGSSYSQNNRQYSTPTYNRYGSNTGVNHQRDENSSHNIYVTNSRGQIEYYINAQGKKIYV